MATPTISSFLLTMGRDRTFLIFHPVSFTASFCQTNQTEHPDYFSVQTSEQMSLNAGCWFSPEMQSNRLLECSSYCRSRRSTKWKRLSQVCLEISKSQIHRSVPKNGTYKSVLSHIWWEAADQSPVVRRGAAVSSEDEYLLDFLLHQLTSTNMRIKLQCIVGLCN